MIPSVTACPHPFRVSRAFSLVETVLAIGLVAFGLVSLLGLMPVGLSTFRSAMNHSISSEIVGQVVSDLRLEDTASLESRTLYFDAQAAQLADREGALYFVNVIPQTNPESVQPANLSRILVEIVKNPAGHSLQRDAQGRVMKTPEIEVWCHPVFLSRI